MAFHYTLASFDLDGTLAESKQLLSIEMAERLFALAISMKVVIISGGSFIQFQKQIIPTWLRIIEKKPTALVTRANSNLILLPVCGTQQYFYDAVVRGWVLKFSEQFDEKLRKKVLAAIEHVIASGEHDIPRQSIGPHTEDRGTQITFSALGQDAPFLQKQEWDRDNQKKTAIRDRLAAMLPELEVRVGGSTSIDILPKGFDKAVGLQKLLDYLHIKKKDAIFVGDAIFPGGNDDPVAQAGVTSIDVDTPAETVTIVDGWLREINSIKR